ncbi:acetamidase/formamidase family protein [Virgibacillus halodenitrificans]|uniref:Acetamidase n=1 Tax=Virgibacillus halodenitrificans TaxID=1482 RepID=A0AAC9J285_VIRHA|nr:acetamidase/formamidase family protein [Virgibacillus halodenitrificans]APC49575.1 acetamidase [Virgibacillus halodenitrificans]MEC2159714.1 acetamidase/formamidase family protein [Virgibacillus halodenitrificans]MYL56703.1 acetamidase [Virgibacillus halodenitrificans]
MKFFSKEKTINYFSPYIEPNFTVNLEETIMVETHDCYGGQINSESILRSDIDLGIMNQATGPIYVNNLTKNDVLKVTISDINLDDNGIMITSPGLGILGEEIKTPTTRILKVRDNKIHFDKKISIPVKPMIGVIGVATKKDRIHTAIPNSHGGNMDTKDITIGSTIYFPVFQEGGLLALGDLHASMGDGELNGTGVEIGGRVTMKLSKISGKQISSPILETEQYFQFISSGDTLDKAIKNCSITAIKHLQKYLLVNFQTAYRLLSATCDIKVSQIVNKLVTVRIAVPKKLLNKLFGE